MRRVIAAALLAASCGAPATAPLSPSADAIVDEAAGTHIVFLPRATDGRVWLSLWIDAGARDADPPQLATVAAWAAVGGEPIDARVLPDGIELSRPCTRDELDACLRSLAGAIRTRAPSEAALEAAVRRLADARRSAATDEGRRADALAMEALLGASVDPLGSAADDARVDRSRVRAFLSAHGGAGRLLLVAVGDVDAAALRRGVVAAFEDLPRVGARRAERTTPSEHGVRVAVGDEAMIAAAMLRPSVSDAERAARRLVARVDADLPGGRASAEVFPLRGGGAIIARVRGIGDEHARVLLDHVAELAEEPAQASTDPPPPEDGPRALARWIGARWASRQEQPARAGIGVGAIVAGGRGDRVGEDDPDAMVREAATRTLTAVLREVTAPITIEGIDAEGGDARAEGVALRARRLPGATRLSAVVLFEGGASEDPPDAHGVTALLAGIASAACEGIAQRELGQTLGSLGIEATTMLGPDSWGLRVEGPSDRWREVAFLAPRCAAVPDLSPSLVEESRALALARASQPRHAARALAGALLAPASPGRVAPSGSTSALAGVSVRVLTRARSVRVGRARATIAIAGDVPMDEAARVLARGAARWPEGQSAEPGPWLASSERLSSAHANGHEAVVAWAIDAPNGEAAARVFARTAARALSEEPGLRELWHDAGAAGGRVWALVALGAAPEALDALPAHVARALRAVGHAWPSVAEAAIAEAAEQRAWAHSSPRGAAVTLATRPPDALRPSEARRIVETLAQSSPHFVILRPQPGRH